MGSAIAETVIAKSPRSTLVLASFLALGLAACVEGPTPDDFGVDAGAESPVDEELIDPDDGDASGDPAAAVLGDCGGWQRPIGASASVTQTGNPATQAMDGSLETRWSGKGIGASIVLDLGTKKQVCRVDVGWYQGASRRNTFALALSTDGVTFTEVYAGTSALNASLQRYPVRPRDARYIKLIFRGNTVNDWASVTELQARAFVLRQTKPTAANTGAGIIRPYPTTQVSGDVVLTTPGARLVDKIIHGRVIVKAPDVVISNCVIDGGQTPMTGNGWVIQTTDSRAVNARIEYTTLRAVKPSYWMHGIGPRNYTAYRVDVSGVVDAFSSFPVAADQQVNVSIEGSYAHDLVHFSPDPNHSGAGSRTHNDGVQSQGGIGLRVIGSNLSAYHDPILGTQPVPNPKLQLAAVMINNNIGRTRGLVLEDNWLGGGVYCVNGGGAPGASATFTRNKFDRGSLQGQKPDESYTLVLDSALTHTATGNVYEDNQHPVKVRTGY